MAAASKTFAALINISLPTVRSEKHRKNFPDKDESVKVLKYFNEIYNQLTKDLRDVRLKDREEIIYQTQLYRKIIRNKMLT